jgi:nucleotide-binding universal stress UspA family protein
LSVRGRLLFEKVLFPTDLSVSDQKIIQCIREIPGITEVVLFHGIDTTNRSIVDSSYGSDIENARLLLAEKKEFLENQGLKVKTIIDVIVSPRQEGDIVTNILDSAEKENVSLILLGGHEKKLIQSLFLGSFSSDVLQQAKTSVLILHGDMVPDQPGHPCKKFCSGLFSKVLIPTDFSRPADDAISFVKSIKEIKEIALLHVVTGGEITDEIESTIRDYQAKISEIARELTRMGFIVKPHIRVGDPTEMILSVGEEEDVSLIAMSPHGKRWFEDFLMGSTAFAVARSAKRPVLIIRNKNMIQT